MELDLDGSEERLAEGDRSCLSRTVEDSLLAHLAVVVWIEPSLLSTNSNANSPGFLSEIVMALITSESSNTSSRRCLVDM